MKRDLKPAGARLWATVVATVRPLPGRTVAQLPAIAAHAIRPAAARPPTSTAAHPPPTIRHQPRQPQSIEPRRRHRLVVEREPLDGRLDLHGLDQGAALAALTDFVLSRHAQGQRSVLVITGKGALGDGVLRRRVPEWLAAPPLRGVVAGLSEAHRRHGGEGALYVVLKRQGVSVR
jgi:DNA-nicking Smr family endonuclease